MTIEDYFILFAISQGSTVLGITIFIFWHYLPRKKCDIESFVKVNTALIALSYLLLTAATIETAAKGVYKAGDFWYLSVTAAYIIGDISLLILFRYSLKKFK